MSKSKPQVSSKEVTKTRTVTNKPRSTSISRRDDHTANDKVRTSDIEGGSRTLTEERNALRRKPVGSTPGLSKEVPVKTLSQKKQVDGHISKMQVKTSKQSMSSVSKPSKRTPGEEKIISSKSRTDADISNRNRSKDQHKLVDSNKVSQLQSQPRIKATEVKKTSPRSSEPKAVPTRMVKQEKQSSVSTKPTSTQPGKSIRKDAVRSKEAGSIIDEVGGGEGMRLNRERTKTRTLNPEDSQLMTSLQHIAQQLPQDVDQETEATADAENDYEDDFEDYESDFEDAPSLEVTSEDESDDDPSKQTVNLEDDDDDKENYDYGDSSSSSSDLQPNKDLHPTSNGRAAIEEKKMDSGHYDLTEERRLSVKITNTTLDSVVYENQLSSKVEIRNQRQEIPSTPRSLEVKAINFAQAKKRQQERKASSKLKHRGEILLNMIRLDSVSFPLFETAPVPYEVYMRSYGRSNTMQVSCQTNDDGMTEEVQTDEIIMRNKWTQHPPAFVRPDDSMVHPVICAVSSDPCDEDDKTLWQKSASTNIVELEKFILNTGQLMLNILEETSSGTEGLLKSNKVDLGFSQGFIILSTDSVPFLRNRRVSRICFAPHQPNSLLTVHLSSAESSIEDDLPLQMVKRCLLCLWNLLQPSRPLKIFVSGSDVTACTFHPFRPHILFAGLSDGILNVWNLQEQSTFQSRVVFDNEEWLLKSPSYTTADHFEMKHCSAVVGVQVLDSVTDNTGRSSELSPTQVCSLDENGLCLIWTLLSSSTGMQSIEDVGIAPWGCVRLLQNESFSLAQRLAAALDSSVSPNVQFTDLALDSADLAHLLATTNSSHVVHSLSSGGRAHPTAYLPDWEKALTFFHRISVVPIRHSVLYLTTDNSSGRLCTERPDKIYKLTGCGDGTIRMYSRHSARPLLTVTGSGAAVNCLQWSNCRPCVFFALDSDSRLHVWDLASSDIYPMLTIPFKGKVITTMQLSPIRHSAKACPYLALGTSCGKLKVHLIKEAYASLSLDCTATELDKFKRYVSIL